ncbi:MAG: hypothetical protein EXR62_05035 [Chloroflexi bacterium]|nr:hypothetical protein [Chloroflexota bacterium]
MHFTIEDVIASGDKVVIRWTLRGTNTGPRADGAATGKAFDFSGMNIFRFASGQVAEAWVNGDTLLMQQQLGLIPAH